MFGGLEDGAEIAPEPLLDEDIIDNLADGYVLITFHFGVKPLKKKKQWTVGDTKEFDELGTVLAEMGKSVLQSEETKPLENAVAASSADAAQKRRQDLREKRRKRRRRRRKSSSTLTRTTKDKELTAFIKAARYVRGSGASKIHPSAKLRLYGLMMQAKKGDAPADTSAASDGKGGAAKELRRLKLEAWRAEHGKDRKEAMEEHISLLTSIAPQWKVEAIFGAHESMQDNEPRKMMWVVKVHLRKRGQDEMESAFKLHKGKKVKKLSVAGALPNSSRFSAESVEVIQANDGANSRLWSEQSVAAKEEDEKEHKASTKSVDEGKVDPFIASFSKSHDLSLDDCLIDKNRHKTIKEQRSFYAGRLREAARTGSGAEEDGWKFRGKTKTTSKLNGWSISIQAHKIKAQLTAVSFQSHSTCTKRPWDGPRHLSCGRP